MHQGGNYHLLIEKIDVFIRRYYVNKLLRGLILWGAVLFTGYIVATLCEYLGHFTTFFRSLIFYGFILLNVVIIVRLIFPPLMAYLKLGNTINHEQAAEIIGLHFTEVQDKLLNTLQLKAQADQNPLHRQLIEASINQKIETLQPVRFPTAVNLRENIKQLKWVAAPAALILILALVAPAILTEGTRRLIKHNEYFAPVATFKFVVVNNKLSATQGEDFKLDLKLQGDQLPTAVYIEADDHTFKLDKQSATRFSYQFTNLQHNTTFHLSGGGYTSNKYQIIINARPSLLHFDAALTYPAYLHKQNEVISNVGDLNIPAGTAVSWKMHTQHADLVLFLLNGHLHRLNPSASDEFTYSERILKPSAYTLKPVNGQVTRTDSASYHINVIADELPAIAAEQKQDSVSMKTLYFNGKIQDDHGFSSLRFHYIVKPAEQNSKAVSYSQPVKADLRNTQSDFFYYWNLKDLKAKPGDHITYYFEVADNDGVAGPKSARTPAKELDMPTEQQIATELNTGTQQVKQKMQSAAKLAAQLEREAQRLNQTLLNKASLSFDEKKQVEDLMQKRKDLDALVKELQDDNKKNLYNRQQNQQQTQQVTEMQNQMDKLLQNLLDPKTQEMMQKMQEMMQLEQKDATREQLSNMQTDNKDLKKELDRMLELYKKMEFDQKLNQNINQLNQLAEQQQKLADQAQQRGADKQELQQQQQKIKQDFQDVKKSLEELKKSAAQLENQPKLENSEKEQQQIDQQMDKSSEEISKNNMQKASKSQKDAAQQITQLSKKLKDDNDEKEGEETNLSAQQLRELLKNLVNSSFGQEKLMQTFKATSASDPNYVTLSQQQKDIKDNLKTAEDSLYSLSKRVPQIQSTVNEEISSINDHINKAIDNLGDRRTAEANRNQQYAMTSMNNLALMLNEVLDQLQNAMKNAKGGKGKSKQSLQQLSQLQQQLNNNMQKMRDQLQQGNKGQSQQQGQSEQLARMARQQQLIRQAVEQYGRNELKDGKNGSGNLDKIAKQMEQTENDLVNRRISEESLKRQQQIQTRLLEAEKAQQEREQDKQRQSLAGKQMPPGYIKALQNYQQLKVKQTEQLKTVSPDLNLYYKQKVKKYFDQLNGK
ncbi:DUF4175 family protein [Mucilaginibacter polytrichastri]|uniref:DUF4175 domain-containing protein n=1 Tax=Mucilaginibacter polytrichastri TaxID=1302689 RepID=A0A1Q6A4T1_9SPHI|nr:DUF4175 family protein [Mucilaginibacter polytrichastri]OKS89003.1 hypothetical protein RG47T_4482 [Mucilaginibacter polytrichastri]SFS95301.1 hypothetical protein SAMN04487890_10743 [Mucilaginibacter polytrichastri]